MNAVPAAEIPPLMMGSAELKAGMVIARDLLTREGIILLGADHVLTDKLIRLLRLREMRDESTLVFPIKPVRTA
jgi:hypothetical protein